MKDTNTFTCPATEEIQTFVSRFANASMRKGAAAFKKLWAEDAEWIIVEPFPLHMKGRGQCRGIIFQQLGQWKFFAQLPHSLLVRVDGTDASQITRMCCGWTFDMNRSVKRTAVGEGESRKASRPPIWQGR